MQHLHVWYRVHTYRALFGEDENFLRNVDLRGWRSLMPLSLLRADGDIKWYVRNCSDHE